MSQDERHYEKIGTFVDEMNASASKVGDESIYEFASFRNAIGFIFILITTVALAFIAGEFVRQFTIKEVFGVDLYWTTIVVALIVGFKIAYKAEKAKITTIKASIFSIGHNQIVQMGASVAIIAVLVLVNAHGVQKIADFSLRYLDGELKESYLIKLKEKKMDNHASMAKANPANINSSSIETVKMEIMNAKRLKDNAIRESKTVFNKYTKGRDPRAYRTLIAQQREKMSKRNQKIESEHAQKMSKLSWKLDQRTKNFNGEIAKANALKIQEQAESDKAQAELETYYKGESAKNTATIEKYKNIGWYFAVIGEIIDGVLAFILFHLVKSNPNTNGTPEVDENTRALAPKIVAPKREVHTVRDREELHNFKMPNKARSPKPKAHSINSEKRVGQTLFKEIERVAKEIAAQKDEYIDNYLRHATQREIIAVFANHDISVTPLQIQEYYNIKSKDLIFVNQKFGFVYAKAKEAA